MECQVKIERADRHKVDKLYDTMTHRQFFSQLGLFHWLSAV